MSQTKLPSELLREAVATGEPEPVAMLRLYLERQGGDVENWEERWNDFEVLVEAVRAMRRPRR